MLASGIAPSHSQRSPVTGLVHLVLARPARGVQGEHPAQSGASSQARETLSAALEAATAADDKQRTVILGDLAAVEAAQDDPEAACRYAEQALDQLGRTWYVTGMGRVLEVRKALQPWAGQECVLRLDDRLYGWRTTLSALQH